MNQILDNPFPYSSTNKRYHTFSYASKKIYGQKIAKIPLNAGFTCPNRDGTKGVGGCRFCSAKGSGDSILADQDDLASQYRINLERARRKWPNALGMAYFQSFSNTYAPLEMLKAIYTPFFESDDVRAIAIATRSDCFEEETAAWLEKMQNRYHKDVWIEFGLQTIHQATLQDLNICHSPQDAQNAISCAKRHHLRTVLHLINGLPAESDEMMLETAQFASSLHPDALKIHMLHLLKDTSLGAQWQQHPFDLLDFDHYVTIVCDQLEHIDPAIIIERITGDGMADDLLAPSWTSQKTAVANAVDTLLFQRDSWQGKFADPHFAQTKPD